ncbi:MAG: hypothetical protein AAFQ89_04820 [Cyanobacteria bacterium J06626_18]
MSLEQIEGLWLVFIISLAMICLSPISYWALTAPIHSARGDRSKSAANKPVATNDFHARPLMGEAAPSKL